MKDFTAIDVELANTDPSSICEIGVARFRNCQLIETWRVLIDPKSEFGTVFHSNLHGITDAHIQGAPSFPDIYETLSRFIKGEVCIAHSNSGFDSNCLKRACESYGLDNLSAEAEWHSTVEIARELLPGEPSYKLEALCKKLGHQYVPHNALEDAIASAAIVLSEKDSERIAAISGSGGGTDRPRTFRKAPNRKRRTGLKGNPDGVFYQTHIVITGVLGAPWQDRSDLELHLNELGFVPRAAVSRKTKILVVGTGAGKKKIEAARETGIEIMDEKSFWTFVSSKSKD